MSQDRFLAFPPNIGSTLSYVSPDTKKEGGGTSRPNPKKRARFQTHSRSRSNTSQTRPTSIPSYDPDFIPGIVTIGRGQEGVMDMSVDTTQYINPRAVFVGGDDLEEQQQQQQLPELTLHQPSLEDFFIPEQHQSLNADPIVIEDDLSPPQPVQVQIQIPDVTDDHFIDIFHEFSGSDYQTTNIVKQILRDLFHDTVDSPQNSYTLLTKSAQGAVALTDTAAIKIFPGMYFPSAPSSGVGWRGGGSGGSSSLYEFRRDVCTSVTNYIHKWKKYNFERLSGSIFQNFQFPSSLFPQHSSSVYTFLLKMAEWYTTVFYKQYQRRGTPDCTMAHINSLDVVSQVNQPCHRTYQSVPQLALALRFRNVEQFNMFSNSVERLLEFLLTFQNMKIDSSNRDDVKRAHVVKLMLARSLIFKHHSTNNTTPYGLIFLDLNNDEMCRRNLLLSGASVGAWINIFNESVSRNNTTDTMADTYFRHNFVNDETAELHECTYITTMNTPHQEHRAYRLCMKKMENATTTFRRVFCEIVDVVRCVSVYAAVRNYPDPKNTNSSVFSCDVTHFNVGTQDDDNGVMSLKMYPDTEDAGPEVDIDYRFLPVTHSLLMAKLHTKHMQLSSYVDMYVQKMNGLNANSSIKMQYKVHLKASFAVILHVFWRLNYLYGIVHGDAHLGNIVMEPTNTIQTKIDTLKGQTKLQQNVYAELMNEYSQIPLRSKQTNLITLPVYSCADIVDVLYMPRIIDLGDMIHMSPPDSAGLASGDMHLGLLYKSRPLLVQCPDTKLGVYITHISAMMAEACHLSYMLLTSIQDIFNPRATVDLELCAKLFYWMKCVLYQMWTSDENLLMYKNALKHIPLGELTDLDQWLGLANGNGARQGFKLFVTSLRADSATYDALKMHFKTHIIDIVYSFETFMNESEASLIQIPSIYDITLSFIQLYL